MAIQAFDSARSKGRREAEQVEGDPFRRDFLKAAFHTVILRMMYKRQVFSGKKSPVAADTRISHTVSVRRIAGEIACGLRLNEWLVSAISMCHDVTHCPYGHLGERVLNQYLAGTSEYDHTKVAAFVLSKVADLNLSYEVLDGIGWHSLSSGVMKAKVPAEYRAVAWADKFAYVNGDARDAFAMLSSAELRRENTLIRPGQVKNLLSRLSSLHLRLGSSDYECAQRLVCALVAESEAAGEVRFESNPLVADFMRLKGFLDGEIYAQTDLPEHIDRLHRVLNGLIESDVEGNPHLLFALLTEPELEHLDRVGRVDQKIIDDLPVGDLPLPTRDDFSFLTPDFSWVKP